MQREVPDEPASKEHKEQTEQHTRFLCGMRDISVHLQQHLDIAASTCVRLKMPPQVQHNAQGQQSPTQQIEFIHFPPGSVLVLQYLSHPSSPPLSPFLGSGSGLVFSKIYVWVYMGSYLRLLIEGRGG